ncbi:putative parvulin-type peptidyl-prolyl cis-trans isomerase [Methylacidimicrobium cyclopophantes]|uniref:Parvulin-type peptidyl-prolyl cis-trans isomerase n=1 Tax=Methylacidimicrobium cyclopophantes TaxID=1041766 RepID=A0A5E6MCP6_9BACT|nr:peptidyl-prolyl cis-trans isomerase [Methylacidimicrobium cyclopophantes]VVM07018.1 putative parvulin-type peptidyl-prolyl cis-trans isomerase [Methylacidimicrobium cyclopophantes]
MMTSSGIKKRFSVRLLAFLMSGLGLALIARGESTDPVVASVNGVEIRQSEVRNALAGAGITNPNPEAERNAINALIQQELLVQEAYKRELEQSSEVKAAVAEATRKILANAALRQHLQRRKLTDEELRKRYDQAVASLPKREYRLRHVVTETRSEAAVLLDRLRSGVNFSILARRSLDKATADRGGEVGWQSAQTLPTSALALVEKLAPGQIGGPILSGNGWEVIQLLEVRPVKVPTFAEAKLQLQQQIEQESAQQLVQQLAASAQIEAFLAPPPGEPVAAAAAR